MNLVYSIAPNGGLCFAELDRALEISRIHNALNSSKTWADFKRVIPPTEYARIVKHVTEYGDEDAPLGDDSFSSDSVPGVGDGDYPPWLQPEMSDFLPDSVLERYGKLTSTMLNGGYYDFRKEDLDGIIQMLRELGHDVDQRTDLTFW